MVTPNIIRAHANGPPFLPPLLLLALDREYLDESFLWNLMCQVVVALEVCHGRVGKGGARRPIIHRDLKPDNVFLTSDNVVKVSFGHNIV